VTGAGRGIGRAIAIRFSREGYAVALVSRTETELLDVQNAIQQQGGEAFVVPADVSIPASVEAATASILERTGQIDVLVNNAGISPMSKGAKISAADIEIEEWNMVLAVNLTGTFLFCKSVARNMIGRRSGVIVNISSAAARMGGISAGAHYVASKAGMIGLTKVLARDLGMHGIRVNCIAPGRISTPMLDAVTIDPSWAEQNVPLGRMGVPDDIAEVAVFLASDKASYIHGATLDVNGGWVLC
jgi:3-oxoacyl-[acyl-carrier protein] reductase